ncbi:HD domain-containing protein [Alkalibacillus salilacus]|uniref:HD domain-containing protein n=1 Tax=Alkalibacillus salilacus TaxID=284582 RepID=A0ABT9VEU8_9BACI|nr:HD domain-containing protein [Alkalibacillus salilacus]MDQ0159330.1 uncharacterized protein [Alkalibacillus salilacus]
MNDRRQNIIQETEQFVQTKLETEGSGHDWWHIYRVVNNAKQIADTEAVDQWIVEMAALLHDVIDDKVTHDVESSRVELLTWLKDQHISYQQIDDIFAIIDTISFKHGYKTLPSREAEVVQDADRLDAIGAIGIARSFTYAGSKGHLIHQPDASPRANMTADEYRNETNTAINHFYEKLLTLKEKMNTAEGYRMAEKRHQFMETYLEQFYAEWDGKA